ncbi:formimidoylglutamate deiminase [Maricaulis sp.]|uniref:formimidoylglutamate deiminase n=1 Tax=Maricaulis sp. TaxID=1486257 RepID=UPI00262436B6|nr:formimidoylglutamate deiminase [Maricaulis sp.]
MKHLFFDHALLKTGWAEHVRVAIDDDGRVHSIEPGTAAQTGDRPHRIGLPGMANLHSHAFQRAMAGLSEFRTAGRDSFWSWRELMYRFVARLGPDDLEAIAALAYCDMLETGFTSVGEFHYLHNQPGGQPYGAPAEMSERIIAAASQTGIALTLMPVLYRWSGFDRQPAQPRQARFTNDLDRYAALYNSARDAVAGLPRAKTGLAPHSLRAVDMADLQALLSLDKGAPVHIHIAEQTAEVEACIAAHGAPPIAYLLDQAEVNEAWCLVHATHMTDAETDALARTRAVAGLCPITEANLGDGIFPAPRFLARDGRFGIGSDSHIRIDLAEELRLLEYGHRLQVRERNVLARPGEDTASALYTRAAKGGAQAIAQGSGQIETGQPADIVTLNPDAPVLRASDPTAIISSWIFSGDGRCIETVYVSGRNIVENGRAIARDEVERRFGATLKRLRNWAG